MKNIPLPDLIQRASDLVLGSKYTVVFTGAGISTPSGIPDFRSANDGLWTKSDPMEVASYSAFRYHPEKFFNWLKPLAEHIWDASPNSAHESLAQLEQAGYIQALITQNIDGLHQKAGSKQVVEVHGSMNHLRCMVCRLSYPADAYFQQFISAGELPRCSNCHSLLKPEITLFEELLPYEAWSSAVKHSENADLFIVIGSSLEVTPASSLPLTALQSGAKLIINTLSSTYLDQRADLVIPYDVTEAIPAITQTVLQNSGKE
ncbi:MAG: SIR2 family NAD-dependent protein deacylase [Bellilinea sp.]